MDKNPKSLKDSPRYKNFIELRDEALEKILHKYLEAQSKIMDRLLDFISDITSTLTVKSTDIPQIERKLNFLFQVAAESATDLLKRMRRSSYVLANAGEVQSIARSIGKVQKVNLPASKVKQAQDAPGFGDADIGKRVEMYFNRLKRNVLSQIEMSIVLQENPEDAMIRIKKVFPEARLLVRPKKALRSLKEADVPDWLIKARQDYLKDFGSDSDPNTYRLSDIPPTELTTGIIDRDAWEQMVQDYKSKELPESTFTRGTQDFIDEQGVRTYDWELENEMMNDFVKNVRSGQVDAANENGITDLMWIAVSHKTLCEHCEWRDGLTSEEIEKKLEDEHSDDPYDTIVPPAHPFCYCKLAPVTKELLDLTPDDSVEKEFDEWLNS